MALNVIMFAPFVLYFANLMCINEIPPPNFRGGVFIYPYCAVKPIISLICYRKVRNLFINTQKKSEISLAPILHFAFSTRIFLL